MVATARQERSIWKIRGNEIPPQSPFTRRTLFSSHRERSECHGYQGAPRRGTANGSGKRNS